jgi:hypothetical protein
MKAVEEVHLARLYSSCVTGYKQDLFPQGKQKNPKLACSQAHK